LKDYVRINLDTLHTRNKEKLVIEEAIKNKKNIVVDNTNLTKVYWARYIGAVSGNGYEMEGYFMQSKIQDCIERNKCRTGKEKIPRTAIAVTANKLEMTEYSEGFDRLYFVSIADGEMKVQDWRTGGVVFDEFDKKMRVYEQSLDQVVLPEI